MMWAKLAYVVARKLYPYLKPVIQEKVNDPKHKWDDAVVKVLDEVFK